MSTRRKGRELALQALYQLDITEEESERTLSAFWQTADAGARAKEFARELVSGVLSRKAEIDALVAEASENWRIDRLSRVDLNTIRIAVYELITPPGLPGEIVINEAVEIARKFGSEDSAAFVNGVLDQIAKLAAQRRAAAASELK